MAQSLSERAEAAREALFQRYDQLNALWTRAEEQLTTLHIPRSVEFSYSHYSSDPRGQSSYDIYECLGLQKVKGKWRICHGEYCESYPMVEDWTPITECSAQIRVDAAQYLPKFKAAVIKSAEDFIPKVDFAIETLRVGLESDDSSVNMLVATRAKLNGKAK